MAYTDMGQGIPILFVHGFPLNRKIWVPQTEGLRENARILAPDLRSHGDSQMISGPYSMELFADDLNDLLDAVGVNQPIVLCGLSMGGYIAFAFYRKFAYRLIGLILISTRATMDSPAGRAARDQAISLAREEGVVAIVETMLPRMFSPKNYESRPKLVRWTREIMGKNTSEGIIGDLFGLRDRPDSTSTLSQIRVPTLVVAGADDQIIPLNEAQKMTKIIPGARLEVIPESGHLPNLENHVAFNRVILDFLSHDLPRY